jgi:hypothetical protein
MPHRRKATTSLEWDAFLEAIARDFNSPIFIHRNQAIAWLDGEGHVSELGLIKWLWPSPEYPRAPRITRISINNGDFTHSRAELRRLQALDDTAYRRSPGRPASRSSALCLEWTVLESELLDFASWLPVWMRGRLDQTVTIPLPPHASHVWSRDLRRMNYAWTVTAFEAHAKFHRRTPSLHPCATPASQVKPSYGAVAGPSASG